MNLRKKLIAKELKEALGGGETSVTSSAGVLRYKDNPLVQEVQKLMKDKFKDVTLEFIHENGDIWEIGFRFEIEDPSPQMQYSREMAKQRSYEIKRELEIYLMPKFAIPSFSIQGVKTVRAEDKVFCEFAISLIYANKGNLKVNYENYKKKVAALLEAEGEKKSLIEGANSDDWDTKLSFPVKTGLKDKQEQNYWDWMNTQKPEYIYKKYGALAELKDDTKSQLFFNKLTPENQTKLKELMKQDLTSL